MTQRRWPFTDITRLQSWNELPPERRERALWRALARVACSWWGLGFVLTAAAAAVLLGAMREWLTGPWALGLAAVGGLLAGAFIDVGVRRMAPVIVAEELARSRDRK